jgi:hypothetical protein
MNRVLSLVAAAVLAAGLANVALSETSSPSGEKQPAATDSQSKEQRKADRQQARQERRAARQKLRAERRAARMAKLPACRQQADEKKMQRLARRVFIYQCVRS